MDSDLIPKLKAKRNYLQNWKESFVNAQGIAPDVQRMLEEVEWQIDVLSNRPEEASEIPLDEVELGVKADQDYARLTGILPEMPRYNRYRLSAETYMSGSSVSFMYNYVVQVGQIPTPDAQAYSRKHTARYQELQAAQERPKAVRLLLEKLADDNLLKRFDTASAAYESTKFQFDERRHATSEMRNLLDGLQGVLFQKARRLPKENMTWETMATRLTTGASGGREEQELIQQGAIRSSIYSRLSDVTKDRESFLFNNIDDLWTQVLNHIYVVVGLIKV